MAGAGGRTAAWSSRLAAEAGPATGAQDSTQLVPIRGKLLSDRPNRCQFIYLRSRRIRGIGVICVGVYHTMRNKRVHIGHLVHSGVYPGWGGGGEGPPPPPAQTYHPTFYPPKLSRALVWLVSLFGGYLAPSENPGYAPGIGTLAFNNSYTPPQHTHVNTLDCQSLTCRPV